MRKLKSFQIVHEKGSLIININITKSKKGFLDIDYDAGNIDVKFIMSLVEITDNYCPVISDLFTDEKELEKSLIAFLEKEGYNILTNKFYDCLNKKTNKKVAYSNLSKISEKLNISLDGLKYIFSRKKEISYETDSWIIERRYIL